MLPWAASSQTCVYGNVCTCRDSQGPALLHSLHRPSGTPAPHTHTHVPVGRASTRRDLRSMQELLSLSHDICMLSALLSSQIQKGATRKKSSGPAKVRTGEIQLRREHQAPGISSESICRKRGRAAANTLISILTASSMSPLELLKSQFYGQGLWGITSAQPILTWRQIILCRLLSDKCSCQCFVFYNISLSYLFACFDFWSSVGRKAAKNISPVS